MEVRLSAAATLSQVERLAALLRRRGERIATAESCTGGLIAAACTSLVGSSDWFERGFVTYSNEAKIEMLGVPAALIAAHGAVSAEVASAMAEGALSGSRAAFALSVTGIAGPGGGSAAKPVGTVWIGIAGAGEKAVASLLQATGDRAAIREASVARALELLIVRCAAG
ncbi:MAG: nicotinamide-nucleotide amidohydrolase family protein [Caldimonas sp.]